MKLIPAGFDIRLSGQGGRAVILTIQDIDGGKTMVPINPDVADELGRQLLAGAMALNGKLLGA